MTIPSKERDLVRELARSVVEIANEPRMDAIQKRWRDVDNLRKPDRAPVLCRPVGCWSEILPEETLVCTDPWLRQLEQGFRQTIHKREINDDTLVDDFFYVGAVFNWEPANLYGVDMGWHNSGVEGGAWAYDPPLKTESDFDKLLLPTFTYNDEATLRQIARAAELFFR